MDQRSWRVLGAVIGLALVAPGAAAQSTAPPPTTTAPPPATTASPNRQSGSTWEQLGAALLRQTAPTQTSPDRTQAQPPSLTGAPARDPRQGATQSTTGTPPPTVTAPPRPTTRNPIVSPSPPPTRTPPPTGGPTPPPGAGPVPGVVAVTDTPRRPRRPGQVDWPAAVADQKRRPGERQLAAGGARLDPTAVNRTRLPILVPADPATLKRARFYSFGDYYSLNLDSSGATVELTGTRVFGPTPDRLTRLKTGGPERVSVQRTVDGWLLSFTRYNLLYTVEVRCDLPRDARCKDDRWVREVYAETQAVVLGEAARAEAGSEARP